MTAKKTPKWIENLDFSSKPATNEGYSAEIDIEILNALRKLTFEELDQLADSSGIRDYLGVLTPSDEWSRDQYIEILSDISEMTDPQIQRLRELLKISRNDPS